MIWLPDSSSLHGVTWLIGVHRTLPFFYLVLSTLPVDHIPGYLSGYLFTFTSSCLFIVIFYHLYRTFIVAVRYQFVTSHLVIGYLLHLWIFYRSFIVDLLPILFFSDFLFIVFVASFASSYLPDSDSIWIQILIPSHRTSYFYTLHYRSFCTFASLQLPFTDVLSFVLSAFAVRYRCITICYRILLQF